MKKNKLEQFKKYELNEFGTHLLVKAINMSSDNTKEEVALNLKKLLGT